jgi:FADH2 O2-dependent halogenase
MEQMEEANFPHKFGAVWTANEQAKAYSHEWDELTPESHADVRFDEREQPGVNKNYTFHVDRGKFDLMLLQHAHKLGATVY